MKIGIIPNIDKEKITEVVSELVEKFKENDIEYLFSNTLIEKFNEFNDSIKKSEFLDHVDLFKQSDFILSIGGDGTMLSTSFEARNFNCPLIGINFGKLGFLAEFDLHGIDELIMDLKNGNYDIEERMALEAVCTEGEQQNLFAINDIVIDKGRWPKMIQITIKVDDDYVSTFSADGIIIATPTGSTGYSLSTGGPIVSPKANAITLSPISPHTLTMRPLVLSCHQKIKLTVDSHHTAVQTNCDGQRVYYHKPQMNIDIFKSKKTIKLVHTRSTSYFEILRNKLFWGLDVRNNPVGNE